MSQLTTRGSRTRPVNDAVVFAFASATQWVVFAEGVRGVVFPEEDAAEVGVVVEADAVHVEDFAFGPFDARPEVADGIDGECGVVLDAIGWA